MTKSLLSLDILLPLIRFLLLRSTHQQDGSYKEDFEAAAEHRLSTCEPFSSNSGKRTRSSRYISQIAHRQRIGPNGNVRRRSIRNCLGVPIANNSGRHENTILRYLNRVPQRAMIHNISAWPFENGEYEMENAEANTRTTTLFGYGFQECGLKASWMMPVWDPL
ncbi:hypothetical protein Tco_1129912 [Tanacetum coccineum]